MNKTLVLFLCFFLGSIDVFADPGFFAARWIPRTTPELSNAVLTTVTTGSATAVFTINTADTVNKVLPTIFGNNSNPWLGKGLLSDSTYGLAHLQAAKISQLRMPGGNWSNNFLWDGTNHWNLNNSFLDSIDGAPNQSWTLIADSLVSLAGKIGAEPQICVNYSLTRFIPGPDSVAQAAHYAAEWVRHVNGTLGLHVRYWEVGNENYGSWQAGWLVAGDTLSGDEYGRDFGVFADSMKAADSTIKVGAIVVEQDNGSASGGYRWWMKKMLPWVQDKADYLIYHEYFTFNANPNNVTVAQMLAALPKIANAKDSIAAMVARYTNKPAGYFPLATTEFNVRAGLKNNQAISGIFIAMALCEFVRNGYGLANLWGIVNGYDAVNGDMGMLAKNDPTVTDYTPHPSFYTYFLFGKMWGDVMVNVSPTVADSVYAAASTFSDGGLSVILVNQSSAAQTVQLNLGSFPTDGFAYGYTLQANSPTSDTLSLHGQAGVNFGPLNYANSAPWQMAVTVAPKFLAPPWSIQFVLFQPKANGSAVLPRSAHPTALADKPTLYDLLGRIRVQ